MRREPIEFGKSGLAARAARDRVSRLARRLSRAASPSTGRGVDVIDAAFAGFTEVDSGFRRVDRGESARPEPAIGEKAQELSGQHVAQRELVADLSAQLAAINLQRERLMRLLQDSDPNACSS